MDECCEGTTLSPRAKDVTFIERLDAKEEALKETLAAVQEAKALLEGEPKLKRLLELLSRLRIS